MVKAGLIPVQRTVVRDGKMFQTTVYVKARHENKVDKTKNVQVPDWKFSSVQDFQDEVKRISELRDRSERAVLKESLMDHIETKMGVKWAKLGPNEDRAFVRNTMRAFSAAKKHLQTAAPQAVTPTPAPTPAAPTATPAAPSPSASNAGFAVSKQPGKDYIMPKDDSKKLARAFRDEQGGFEKLLPIMKGAGITWNEVPDVGPNNMRALRALASFMRKGGELQKTQAQPANQQQLVVNNPNQPLVPEKKSKYEKGTIQHDYELAKARHKLIGLASGVMPVDDKTADYLEGLIKDGKFGLIGDGSAGETYGLPAKLNDAVDRIVRDASSKNERNHLISDVSDYTIRGAERLGLFEGTPYKAEFETFKKNHEEFNNKWGVKYPYTSGVGLAERSMNYVDELDKTMPDWRGKNCRAFIETLGQRLSNASTMSDAEVNKLWDDLDFEQAITSTSSGLPDPMIETLINTASRNGLSSVNLALVTATLAGMPRGSGTPTLSVSRQAYQNGQVSKKSILSALGKNLYDSAGMKTNANQTVMERIDGSWDLGSVNYAVNAIGDAHQKGKPFDSKAFKKEAKEILSDLAPLKTPEAHHISFNIALAFNIERFFDRQRSMKGPAKYVPMTPEEVYGDNLEKAMKVHVGAMRKATDKQKETYRAKYKDSKSLVNYAAQLKNGADPTKLEFPDAEKVKDVIKTTLMAAPDDEAQKVAARVAQTHDNRGHKDFKTVVHGVYRVKRIASEEKFQKINDDINNTGFYYHGTSFGTAQKILGETGGFKVFTPKDKGMIKAGSMLGYGIYLASQSSKSMQYVGDGFRAGSRGVLFVCKASIGNAVHTTGRGAHINQPIMNDPKTDSVWMDKPHVVNPEWAVKRAEQAVPRLWIDAERVNK